MRSILRPIFGTIALQPLTFLWAWWTGADYWTMLGPFTVVATIFLIPVYHWYEGWWDKRDR